MARKAATEDGVEAVKAKDLPPNERTQVMFTIPAGLKAKLEEESDTNSTPIASIVRQIVADHYTYELPEIQRGGARKKYANEEEREAARKAKAAKRNNLLKNLLKLYQSGQLPPELLAAMEGDSDEDEDDEDED